MKDHFINATKIASHLNQEFGTHFHPKEHAGTQEQITNVLSEFLFDHTRQEITTAVNRAFTHQNISSISWDNFICIIISFLAGRWTPLANAPGINASTMFLLTDGSVLCQAANDKRWRKLKPDANGNYINGTWSDIAPSNDKRLYYGSAVLADGRLMVSGGEYEGTGTAVWTKKTEIYDPIHDTWTEIGAPAGWNNIGDAPSVLFPDGRLFIGNYNDNRTAIYHPLTNTWTAGPAKPSSSSEESWLLLPDNTVITVRCNSSQRADKYIIASNTWVDGGTLPRNIIEISSSEIGGAVLLPDGRSFFVGANGKTAIYAPPVNPADTGVWSQGPDFAAGPNGETIGSKDAAACLMTNGRVLIAAGPVNGSSWLKPTYFYEFNGTSIYRVADPANNTDYPYTGRMLLLPNGQILFAAQTNAVYAYAYFSCPAAVWKPTIASAPGFIRALHSYTITGTQFNGLSQAVGYGDDAAAATNYPLVRLRDSASGKVYYCRTFDHSTMGVATGTSIQSTQFSVPFGIPIGNYQLYVVANGIASLPVNVSVYKWRFPFAFDEAMVNMLIGSLADGPLWVLTKNGPHPVDPMGPEYIKLAREATNKILDGILTLQKLGDKGFNEQIERLAANPAPIPDETNEEEENKEFKKGRKANVNLV